MGDSIILIPLQEEAGARTRGNNLLNLFMTRNLAEGDGATAISVVE